MVMNTSTVEEAGQLPVATPGGGSAVIQTDRLSKRYGSTLALDDLDVSIPDGVIFGYLGPNGAGKTTTIRLLTGLLRPTSGRARVFGLDVVDNREEIQSRVGYLPGEFVAYPDLTADQYFTYLSSLRGSVDPQVVGTLCERLGLDRSRPMRDLSHGNRQKVGLVQALMHEPELLILDEPTSGLDPLVQREVLTILREIRAEGRTVFLSSHILAEVEAAADSVAILRQGRLVVVADVDTLKEKAVRPISLTFATEPAADLLRGAKGVIDVSVADHIAHVTVEGSTADLFRVAGPLGIESVTAQEPDLEEIFLDYYSNGAADVS